MTWARVDDSLHCHPKRRAAGFEALGLWVVAMSYCASLLTDGHLTDDDVLDLCRGNRRVATKLSSALVDAGLWQRTDRGFVFHDWDHYQPTRASVLSERAKRVEAGRRGGLASAVARASSPAEASAEAGASSNRSTPPTRPPAHPPERAHTREEPGPGPEIAANLREIVGGKR